MDKRDQHLKRHMQRRMTLAKGLPLETQFRWAQKCVNLALKQHRTAFYMMANMWLASLTAA